MSSYSEQFCLKWNNFQENIASSYNELRKDTEFSDVTLVCEDKQHIEAHRLILIASSPLFESIMKRHKHSHPIIYTRGLGTKDLVAMVDFIYLGEANIYQEDLDGFLALAEELQLKGLTGAQENSLIKEESEILNYLPKPQKKTTPKRDNNMVVETYDKKPLENNALVPLFEGKNASSKNILIDPDNEDVKAKIISMMEKILEGEFNWRCTVCGKMTKGSKTHMSRHIESHIDGVSYPCNQCGNISRSSASLQVHISRNHNAQH